MIEQISALVGQLPINEQKINDYGLAVSFEGDYAVVILDEEFMFYWGMKLKLSWMADGEIRQLSHDCELALHFAKEIGLTTFAIVESDYYNRGFHGSFYDKGEPVVIDGSGYEVLSLLGVQLKDGINEFYQLNLDKYRGTEWWYSEYGRTFQWHTRKIHGFVPKH